MNRTFLMGWVVMQIVLGSSPGWAEARNETTVTLDETGVAQLGLETEAVEENGFRQTVELFGTLEHVCENHAVVSSRIAGRVVEVGVHLGEPVEKGQVVARVESLQPGDPPPSIELKAPARGWVVKSELHHGAPVEVGKELMEIQDFSKLWAVLKVPVKYADRLKQGAEVELSIEAAGLKKLKGKWLRLGDADTTLGWIEGVFELDNPGEKLRPGMPASAVWAIEENESAITIPREALLGDLTGRFVYVKDYELEHAFVKVPVRIGGMADGRVEIVQGLLPGDEVVVKGGYALSFSGKGTKSLKEALDAAHGHPHNEDGTEMTQEQIAAAQKQKEGEAGHGHELESPGLKRWVWILGMTSGLLLAALLAMPWWIQRQRKEGA